VVDSEISKRGARSGEGGSPLKIAKKMKVFGGLKEGAPTKSATDIFNKYSKCMQVLCCLLHCQFRLVWITSSQIFDKFMFKSLNFFSEQTLWSKISLFMHFFYNDRTVLSAIVCAGTLISRHFAGLRRFQKSGEKQVRQICVTRKKYICDAYAQTLQNTQTP
jgi:hypothetical protein